MHYVLGVDKYIIVECLSAQWVYVVSTTPRRRGSSVVSWHVTSARDDGDIFLFPALPLKALVQHRTAEIIYTPLLIS